MIKSTIILSFFVVMMVSCSEATSQPSYQFKKNVGDGIVAKIGDVTISEKELQEDIARQIHTKEMEIFEIKFNKLKALLLEKMMKNDPKFKGLTNDQYLEKYILKGLKISDSEVNAFVKERGIDAKKINPQVRARIEQMLSFDKKKVLINNWLVKKSGGKSVNVFIERPQAPYYDIEIGSSPFSGNKDAKVTIVEFSDFQCPYCAKASKMFKKIKKQFGDKVKVVFKQFPLANHRQAKKAAVASLCAYEQGAKAFWQFHDALFEDQSMLAPEQMKQTAKRLKFDVSKFSKCLDDNKYIASVEKDIQQGKKIKVTGTPSIFVNGRIFVNLQNESILMDLINEELAK